MKNKSFAIILVILGIWALFIPNALGEIKVTEKINILPQDPEFNKTTKITTQFFRLQNISKRPLFGPFKVVIEEMDNPQVSILNADGYTPQGKPYFIYDKERLGSKDKAGLKKWVFKHECSVIVRVEFAERESFKRIFRGKCSREVTVWVSVYAQGGVNHPPVAKAGSDQKIFAGDKVTLDGSKSSDGDGDLLTFRWRFVSTPHGSKAALSDSTAVKPTLGIDLPGTYVIQLIVNDGKVDSPADRVIISTAKGRPVANAGPDQTVVVDSVVTLDGSGASAQRSNYRRDDREHSSSRRSDQREHSDDRGDDDDWCRDNKEGRSPGGDDCHDRPLTYLWSLASFPSGSRVTLLDPTAVKPTFKADLAGTYVVQLVVSNGRMESLPDTVEITTGNSRPVAIAGPDQPVVVGDVVTLDGSASSDVDGDRLSFQWSFTTLPATSAATFPDAAVVKPTFVADRPGIYVVQLIANDGQLVSLPDTAVITTTGNSKPVANAGPDQAVIVGNTVTLDGSASSNVDGRLLSFEWLFTSPAAGSLAFLSNPTAVNPTFVVDKPGTYVAQLIVTDGNVDSPADTVVITTGNSKPVANAGPDQTVFAGNTVSLDGSASSDVDGDPLSYSWSLIAVPAGSTATLSGPTAVNPTFVVDLPGTYVVQLIVNDGQLDSLPDTVVITTANSRPVANAGPDQTVFVGDPVTLEGSGSRDADNDPLSFFWSFTSLPAGSTATLSDQTAVSPTFAPDLAGTYVAQLIVNDGIDSPPDTLKITANPRMTVVPDIVGFTQKEAQSKIATAILTIGTVTEANSPTVLVGNVISQDPSTGGSVPELSSVNFVISLGPVMVVVPNVVGQPQASAEAAITAAGLTATIAQAYSTVVIAGNVISQNPAGGASALQGASVNLVVSLGPSGLPPDPATVAPPVDLAVATTLGSATSFLYSGTNPIQTGVAPGTISPIRAAVLRGKVLDRSNNPLPNVTIAILNHPEFGQTLSRADGMFDMAVNGGGLLTVNYAKVGLLPAQRQVKAPWQDYVMAPDVVLIPSDPQVTTVDLTADTPIQVARGSRMTDADGSRQATLLFPQGTQAQLVMPDGTTQALTTLSVRATEYTVGPYGPKAMPGELPPSSGYTYAVELSADEAIAAGATSVRFSQPVPFYVENFVGFPVGSLVPTGFYDRGKGQWVASDNGRVIKVISITGGLADLDLDGNGTADDAAALAALGITDAERQRLAALYTPGQSMWRVLIPHFTPWDCNWPYGPPPGSGGPGGGDDKPKPGPKPDKRPNNPCKKGGSIIGCEPQTLGEVIKVTGTPLSLHYQSDRVPGRRDTNILKIRLSGATLPPGLQRIHLEIAIAGRAIKQNFAPQANLVETFTWDGKDAYGRPVQGQQPATVRIGYEYIAQYYATSDSFEASFNRFGSPPIAVARGGGGGGGGGAVVFSRPLARTTTPPIILWQDYKASLGGFDSLDLGGWSLSVHHTYDVGGRTLYLGNGDQRSAEAMGVTITTVAGTGVNGFAGDGGPATQARLNSPMGVAMGPDGSLYIADTADHRIRRVGPNGIITTVAGTNYGAFAGDGGLATQAWLYNPHGVALGPDGSLYIADTDNHRIRRVGPNGIISTVAGTGVADYSGDGGPATLAGLSYPRGVAVGSDGSLYIASTILSNNQRVRRVGPDGIISTVAGTGGYGFAGDGGLATQALVWPWGVAVGSDGSLYIADYYNHRIRRVGPDGIITTVAGTGVADITGDGGPATQAKLAYPRGVAVGSDGSLYIADYYNNRIRRVGPDGIITTVAGKGAVYYGSFSGDGGLAMQANLYSPQGVAVGPDGSLYVADTFNHRIRQLSPPLPGTTLSDIFIAAEDGSEVYVFNSTGRHLRTLEALTSAVRFQFTYDSANRLATITDSDGNVTTIERDGSGNPSAIVAPFGQRTTLAVDANGYLSHVTNPAGEAVQLTYNSGNAEGLLATLTDPRGNVHRYFYDALGRLIRDENPAGGVTTLARTDITDGHYAVTLTTALGLVTTYEVEELSTGDTRRVRIDPSGARTESLIRTDGSRLITYPDGTVANLVEGPDPRFGMQAPILKTLTVNRPGGTTTTRTATRTATLLVPNNLLSLTAQTETVTINGKTYTSTYSAATKKVTTTTPSGRQSVTTIDAEGRLVQAAVAGIAPVQLAYDGRGRLASLTQDDRTYTLTYDSQGYLSLLTDPLTHSVGFTRDTAGRPTLQTRPDGEQIGLTYDANGNLASLTPPGRPSHEFSYTPIDLLQIYTPPDLGFTPKDTQYVYNPDRQLIQLLQPNVSASLSYDVAGRVQSLVYPQDTVSYGYDSASRLQTIVTSSGINLTYGYDGNLPTDTTWSGPVTGTVHRTYDNNFRTTTRTINGANALSFAYDADGLLVQAGALTLQRNAQNGLLTGTTLGVVNDTLSYNSFGELVNYTANVSATPALSTQFTRDKLGRITQKVETVGGVVHTYDYGYDLAGRLEQVKQDDLVTASYTYDSNGNRLTGPGVLNTATYDDQDRLLSYNGSTYDYTANGALKTKTTGPFITSYDYDVLGNLKHVTLPGGATIDYVIDGQNRRIGKKVGGTLVQGFLYQDDLKPIVELDGTNTVVSRFVYGAGINVPDYMVKGGVTYRIITDHLGGPRVVVNTTDGTIIQRMDYDEFGRVILDTNPGFQPFGFAGGLYDRDTRLVRFGARDYDAETGRWTAKDPMRFRGGQANLYSYVQSDPLNHTDASGLSDGMSGPGGVCISGKDPNDGGMSPAGAGPELVRDGSWYYDPITDTWMLDFSRPSGWLAQKGFGWALGKALGLGFAGARLIGMVLNLEDDMGGRSPGARENKNGNCQCE